MTDSKCRVATLPEIRKILDWAADEGWNPGLDDAAAFHAADPEGFFIAEMAGKPVAAISVVNHSDDFSFLGLYLCLPEYRGQGIAYSLWAHALAHAGNRTVGLDGVPAQEANYARSGFSLAGRTRRLEGTFPVVALSAHLATADDRDALANLDQRANGFARTKFLEAWTTNCESRRTVLLTDGNDIAGFATARICKEGCKVGPVVAPTTEQAFDLAVQAASSLRQTKVILDIPDRSAAFDRLLRQQGFRETFATARMYRGDAPGAGSDLQAIATMELG